MLRHSPSSGSPAAGTGRSTFFPWSWATQRLAASPRFVVVSVYARGNVGPPDGAFVNLATPTPVLVGTVHFYAIEAGAVTHWRSTAGAVQLGNGLPGGPCPGFSGSVACDTADIPIGGSVTASTRESGTAPGAPTLSIVNGLVRGIKLKYTFF